MTTHGRPEVTPEMVARLADIAGLNIGPARLGGLTNRYAGFLDEMDKLKALDLQAEEPATTFSAPLNESPFRTGEDAQ